MSLNFLIIDGTNVFIRGWSKVKAGDMPYQAAVAASTRTVFERVKSLQQMFAPDTTFICFDTPTSSDSKRALYPEYKMNRGKLKESMSLTTNVKDGMEAFLEIAPHLLCERTYLYSHPLYEADDLAAGLIESHVRGEHQAHVAHVTLVSADKDWQSLLCEEEKLVVECYDFATTISASSFQQQHGYAPHLLPIVKAFRGDVSDNMKSVMRVSKTQLNILLVCWDKDDSLFDLQQMKALDAGLWEKVCANLHNITKAITVHTKYASEKWYAQAAGKACEPNEIQLSLACARYGVLAEDLGVSYSRRNDVRKLLKG